MAELTFGLYHAGQIVQAAPAGASAYVAYHHGYQSGDYYQVTVDDTPAYLVAQFDPALAPALVYLTESTWHFDIPVNDLREWPYPESAFAGRNHYASVRYATADEIAARRNLALNSHDLRQAQSVYPHASANAETRGEYVFYARNAIDGYVANESHGNWPFQSWGIDQREDAELTIDFGRPVTIDTAVITLRADYPHDTYWTDGVLSFSDGSEEAITMAKTAAAQRYTFTPRTVTWIKLNHLKRALGTEYFPALTELAVYGQEAK